MENIVKTDNKKFLQIRINTQLLDEFNTITAEESINKSALIRSWIEKFVKEHNKEHKRKN